MLKLTFLVFQEMFNPFFHKENDGHHWILKMMTFHRNEWNAIQRDWCTNVIVLGLCHQHFLKASGMPFVWNFKTPSTIFRNINASLKHLPSFKQQEHHFYFKAKNKYIN